MTDLHLTPETLAAFVDRRLSAAAQADAEAHIAHCQDCFDVFADLTRLQAPAAPSAAIYWGRSAIYWGRTGLAAAAVLALAWVGTLLWNTPDRQISSAVGQLAQSMGAGRPTEARMSGGFQWGPPPTVARGPAEAALPFDAQEAILAIKRLAASHRTARSLGAVGVASLVAGDVDGALAALEEAAKLDAADARILGDLAAARIERWRRTRVPADATVALDAAERALVLAPDDQVALFNRALAVEGLGMRDEAAAAWREYLRVDANSSWAVEAREHLSRLTPGAGGAPSAPQPLAAVVPDTTWSPQRRACLEQARQDLRESYALYDASQTAQAEARARNARAQSLCAGVPTTEADVQVAWTVFFQDRREDALALAAPALGAAMASGDWRSAGRVHYLHGLALVHQGRLSEADDRYDLAIDAFEKADDAELTGTTWALRAEISKSLGDDSGFWSRLAQSFEALPVMASRRQHMVFVQGVTGSRGQALAGVARFLARALVNADVRSGDPALMVGAYLQRAAADDALGDDRGALEALAQAAQIAPSISDEMLRTQFGAEVDALTGTLVARTDPERAIQALNAAMRVFDESGRPLRYARLLLERGRANRAAGDGQAAERDWSAGVAIFEDQRPAIRAAQWRIDHLDHLWDLFRELIIVRKGDARGSLEVAERFRGRALLDAMSGTSAITPLTGAALHDWLPPDVAVVVFATLPDRLLRWTVTRAGVSLDERMMEAGELIALVDAYVETITRGRVDATSALSSFLVPASVQPATTKRIVFLPDGPLYRVPFATLTAPSTARAVIDDFESMVAPSLTTLKAAGRRGPDAERARALFIAAGEAQPRERLPALPGVAAEIDAVRRTYPRLSTRLDGSAVTAARLMAEFPSADIIHFAGHAIADPVVPARSRLLLSSGASPGMLTYEDVRGVPLRAGAIVVLSACDGARGRVFYGEGAVGLPHAFLANGASAVVAALWQVDDAAPPEFWTRFHARLRAGDTPDRALAETQRISRRAGDSPAVWAAFEAVGGLVVS